MKRYNCLDGEMDGLIEFDAQLAISPVKDNPVDRDNFYPASGSYDALSQIKKSFIDPEERARRRARREKKRDLRQERRTIRTKGKAESKTAPFKESQADIEMAKALQTQSSDAETKKGLSTGAIIGIALGGLALLGLGVYFVMKSKNKGK